MSLSGAQDLELQPEVADDAAFLRIAFGQFAVETVCDCGRPLRSDVRLVDVRALSPSTHGRPVLATTRCTRRFRPHRWSALARLGTGRGIPLTRFGRSVL
jgi:hypothetical protein